MKNCVPACLRLGLLHHRHHHCDRRRAHPFRGQGLPHQSDVSRPRRVSDNAASNQFLLIRSNRTFPSSRSAWRERSTPASHCNAIWAGRLGGTPATFLKFLVSNDWVEQQGLGRHKKGRCPTGTGRGRRFCGRSADDRSKGHSALALCLFFLISIAPTSTACIDRTGTNSGDTSMAKSSITGDRPSWPVAPSDSVPSEAYLSPGGAWRRPRSRQC